MDLRNEHDTGKRGAVRNDSGLPVDRSGPGLGVGPGTSATSGRNPGACPPNLPSQPKSGPEVQEPGRFLAAAEGSRELRSEATQPVSCFNQVQINRNRWPHLPLAGRGKHCGRFTIAALDGNRVVLRRVNCKCWDCGYCGPRKAKRYKWAIRHLAEKYQLNKFLSLTLDPKKIEGDAVPYLREVFNKFRTYLRRKYGRSVSFIAVLEFQKNGNPHLHVLLNRYIPQPWIKKAWMAVGGGWAVDIRYVDIHRVSRYLSKYLTKELLLSAPKRSRRVTTSRDLRLIQEFPKTLSWVLLRMSVFALYEGLDQLAFAAKDDEEGILEAFSYFVSNEVN